MRHHQMLVSVRCRRRSLVPLNGRAPCCLLLSTCRSGLPLSEDPPSRDPPLLSRPVPARPSLCRTAPDRPRQSDMGPRIQLCGPPGAERDVGAARRGGEAPTWTRTPLRLLSSVGGPESGHVLERRRRGSVLATAPAEEGIRGHRSWLHGGHRSLPDGPTSHT